MPLRNEGFIAAKTALIDGKKYLTLPGINPTVEIMARSRPSELFVRVMNRVRRYARAIGCEAILIPTNPTIFSNRSAFHEEVRKRYGGRIKKWTKPVQWCESGYSFNEAYEVELKEEKEPPQAIRVAGWALSQKNIAI